MAYLVSCRETARYSAEKLGWTVIRCDDGTSPLPVETITAAVMESIKAVLD